MEELNNNMTEGQEVETQEEKKYSLDEVDALLQAESDRRVTAALKKAEAKTANKIREALKLALMNEAEKYEYELKQREEAILAKERELTLAENKNEASKILAERGLSLALVDFVVAEDAETMSDNINALDKAFKASVKAEVEKRLGSLSPKKNLPPDETITKDTFRNMSAYDQQELAHNNPQLYKALTSNN